MNDQELKLPPQAVEAEQSILGAMMLDNRNIDVALNWLESSDFYRKSHQIIFDAIATLDAQGQAVDVITVSEVLSSNDDEGCDLPYIGHLAKNTPNTGNIKSYVKIVRERAKLRNIIERSQDAISKAYDGSEKPEEIVNTLAHELEQIDKNSSGDNDAQMVDLLSETIDDIEAKFNSKEKLLGYSTGLVDFDSKCGGLQKKNLIVVAGRPSMGKTCFAMDICDEALNQEARIKVFSLEMPKVDLMKRNISRWSNIGFSRIMNPSQLEPDDWPRMTSAISNWNSKHLSIDDTGSLNVNQIRARCRVEKRRNGLDIVVIDYLQLMQLRLDINKVDAIGEVTRSLKNLAKELDVVVILLSQLNRSLENRPNKRPVMSDLRDSGAIEQDADQIWFLYREEVYDPNTNFKGICEVDQAKYRNGEKGVTKVIFDGGFQRFKSYSALAQMQDYRK